MKSEEKMNLEIIISEFNGLLISFALNFQKNII